MNLKKLLATLTMTVMMTSIVTPAFADDTESVDGATPNHYAIAQAMAAAKIDGVDVDNNGGSQDNGSGDNTGDTEAVGYDYVTLESPAKNIGGTMYLPLRATYGAMKNCALNVEYKYNGENKIVLEGTDQLYELYLASDESSISLQKGGTAYPLTRIDGVLYVTVDLFKDTITTAKIELSGDNLLVLRSNTATTVWSDAFWGNMNTYTPSPVTPSEPTSPEEPSTPEKPSTPSTDGTLGAQIVNNALQYLGVPYVWGGTTPSGFDCSGFVQYVYAQMGISIPRVTYDQQAACTPVSLVSLQPGDLVFWGYSAYHVGIYIGNGQFVHAPAPGQSVKIQSYSEYPYESAGRII